ncbi:hypothetical protein LSAT2_011546 [Lamellibrachia satsuma]|nr:hypothetical protein LSAT2_011546 [Lamellibrachia satsuma]
MSTNPTVKLQHIGKMQRRTIRTFLLTMLVCSSNARLNIALNRPAYQSSTWQHDYASKAVDGNLNDNYNSGSCTATGGCNQCLPLWAVDFGTVKSVFEIQITNRGDAQITRLHDFTVGLTNTLPTTTTGPEKSPHVVCFVYPGVFPPTTKRLTCTNYASGRYLFLQIEGQGNSEVLTLCEVKVYPDSGVVAVAAGFREFGDCAIFTDFDTETCAEVTSSDNPLDFILNANVSKLLNTANVRITLRNGDCSDNNQGDSVEVSFTTLRRVRQMSTNPSVKLQHIGKMQRRTIRTFLLTMLVCSSNAAAVAAAVGGIAAATAADDDDDVDDDVQKRSILSTKELSSDITINAKCCKILTARLEKILEENQPREKAGFRGGYSTTDHIHVLNQLKEKCREFNMPLCIAFIDYGKAFDSV